MKVALISGPRAAEPMGLALTELRLLEALRRAESDVSLDIRIVGRRAARRYAKRLGARWIPSLTQALPPWALAGVDLVHLAGLDFPPPRKQPFIGMVYDLSPLHYDDEGKLPSWFPEVIANARVVLTISNFIARELIENQGVPAERVSVIRLAPALEARDALPFSDEELAELGIDPPFVLRMGGYTRRKNVPLLLEAWAQVPTGTLVLAGPPQPARARILDEAPSLARVVTLDYVPQPVLARLMRTAAALVSTSSYEGFGLPPLEAMAAGTPVIAAEAPFVREVCGDAALLVEASPRAIAGALRHIFGDAGVTRRLRIQGVARAAEFNWDRAASTMMGIYANALA